jgi:selenocysteine-specific elongation factor
MILGTAGHVDHGKTALVKALTGVDTDRLEEEKRRGITIELGFAPLRLDGITLGVVDVPGHEAFVRNMLAGATGVDLALLVVAADEGVMPQTREHLAILDLLGIRGGVIALTKCDQGDPDWRALVIEDVRAAVAGTALAKASIVPTSVVSGLGLDHISAAITQAAKALPARDAGDLFRLPIDRAFTVKGTGTVVTGTVWSGTLAADATVRILPLDRDARVRGIEAHGAAAERALPGTRAAIALAGVDLADVSRGMTLVSGPGWTTTRIILAEAALLDSAPRALGPRTAVRFHLGTQDVGARVVCAGGALEPGTRAQARVALDHPVVARAGDRFVLRGGSPLTTLGGGIVNDPAPMGRRARPWPGSAATPRARLALILPAAGAHGVPLSGIPVRTGATPAEAAQLVDSLNGAVVRLDGVLYAPVVLEELDRRLLALVDEHQAKSPLEPGAPLQSIRAKIAAAVPLVDAALDARTRDGTLEVLGALLRRAGFRPTMDPAQSRRRDEILAALRAAGREPPSVSELDAQLGKGAAALLRMLEREQLVVAVESDRYYASEAVMELRNSLGATLSPGREYTPAELRDVLGVSRKYLIPLLEYLDRTGFTRRTAAGRKLAG